jgi:hypothetical protein
VFGFLKDSSISTTSIHPPIADILDSSPALSEVLAVTSRQQQQQQQVEFEYIS